MTALISMQSRAADVSNGSGRRYHPYKGQDCSPTRSGGEDNSKWKGLTSLKFQSDPSLARIKQQHQTTDDSPSGCQKRSKTTSFPTRPRGTQLHKSDRLLGTLDRFSELEADIRVDSGKEEDPRRLLQRQKQIDYGKNTLGYDQYTAAVPRHKRGKEHPRTPDIHKKMSKRAWDGLVRSWRRKLHEWDKPDCLNVSPTLRADSQVASASAKSSSEAETRDSRCTHSQGKATSPQPESNSPTTNPKVLVTASRRELEGGGEGPLLQDGQPQRQQDDIVPDQDDLADLDDLI